MFGLSVGTKCVGLSVGTKCVWTKCVGLSVSKWGRTVVQS